jgi:hypothetical protein
MTKAEFHKFIVHGKISNGSRPPTKSKVFYLCADNRNLAEKYLYDFYFKIYGDITVHYISLSFH